MQRHISALHLQQCAEHAVQHAATMTAVLYGGPKGLVGACEDRTSSASRRAASIMGRSALIGRGLPGRPAWKG